MAGLGANAEPAETAEAAKSPAGSAGSVFAASRREDAARDGVSRGVLLLEYRPPRAHPIVYAGLLVFAFVWFTGSVENLLRDQRTDLYLLYGVPFVATLTLYLALFPTATRIHEHGIAPSRPILLSWWRPFVRWDELSAVYPASYDVTGAFVSPFASSDGKVTQTGLGLEWPDGRDETVQFTPTRFALTSRRSRGYREAYAVVTDLFARQGRPLVPAGPTYSDAEKAEMLARARAPFLPFLAIVLLFASAAPVAWVLVKLGVPVEVALALCLVAPLATSLRSWAKSRERNKLLNALSRAAQLERQADDPTAESRNQGNPSSPDSLDSAVRSGGAA